MRPAEQHISRSAWLPTWASLESALGNVARVSSRWLIAEDSAVSLAVLRIVLFATMLYWATMGAHPVWFAGLPHSLLSVPPGAEWFVSLGLVRADIARLAQGAMVLACLAAIVGWHSRLACGAAVLVGIYLLGLPELWGKVDHYHHLIWIGAVLAVSPCGDALSVDSRGRSVPERSEIYGLPLRLAWVILGLVYLFPGLWKLSLGAAWWAGDNLKWHMYQKWFEAGQTIPWLRLDRVPLLYRAGGLATVVFEVGFLPLVLWRRTRPATLVAGLGFHVICAVAMRIWFWLVPVLYVMFIDWDGLAQRQGLITTRRALSSGAGLLVPWVAGGIILAVSFAGLTIHDSWPIGVYPTFAFLAPSTRTTLEATGSDDQGREVPLNLGQGGDMRARFGDTRWQQLLERIATTSDPSLRRELAGVVIRLHAARRPTAPSAHSYRLYRVTRSVDPDHWHEPPLKIVLLDDFTVPTLTEKH